MLASGTSKARATKNCGRLATRRWNSVCISTGEANILSQIADGGANVRIIDLPDLPFKEKDKDIGYLIDTVASVTKVNYGHAVVEVVEDILKKGSNSLVEYKTRYAELQKELNKRLPPGEGGRIGKSVAFIILSIEVLNKVMGLGWSTDDVKATLVDCAIKQSVKDTEGNKALSYIYNYACANQGDRYYDNEGGTLIENASQIKESTHKISPVIKKGQSNIGLLGENNMIIIDSFCKEILKSEGFEPNAVYKDWKSKGYLKCNEKQFTYQQTLFGSRPRVIYLNSTAMKAVGHIGQTCDELKDTVSIVSDEEWDDNVPF